MYCGIIEAVHWLSYGYLSDGGAFVYTDEAGIAHKKDVNDEKQIKSVLQRTGCENFKLFHGIDECISEFKV